MQPVQFKGSNVVFAKDQPEYLPLPAYKDTTGRVLTCWKMTFWETLKFIFFRKIWLVTETYNGPLQPVFITIDCPLQQEE